MVTAMPLDEFIIQVFCLMDDLYKKIVRTPLRQRGPGPKMTDSEVITIEIVGEWLGFDDDKAIWLYTQQHWLDFFPDLPDRSRFTTQAANLWAIKQLLHQTLLLQLDYQPNGIHLIDGFPIQVCHLTRASRSRVFKEDSEFGYCASKDRKYYGFQAHLLTDVRGIPVDISITAANVDERDVAYELVKNIKGLLIGDKGYIRPQLSQDLAIQGINLQTALRKNMRDHRPKPLVKKLMKVRRKIESTIGQLEHYFNIEKCRCRDVFHLTGRIARKMLSYTVGAYLNQKAGCPLTQFENLISD